MLQQLKSFQKQTQELSPETIFTFLENLQFSSVKRFSRGLNVLILAFTWKKKKVTLKFIISGSFSFHPAHDLWGAARYIEWHPLQPWHISIGLKSSDNTNSTLKVVMPLDIGAHSIMHVQSSTHGSLQEFNWARLNSLKGHSEVQW